MRVLLVAYDNDAYTHRFPLGLAYIAAVMLREGYEVEIYNQDMHHYPDEHLTQYLDQHHFDVVGVSVIAGYYQYRKLLRLSQAISRAKRKPFYVIGGHGPSPDPEFFLKKTGADCAVLGEGEATVAELFRAISNKSSLADISGIAYVENGKICVNERRGLIQDVDSIQLPAYELFPMNYYRLLRGPHISHKDFVMPVLSGRGCTFKCNFCYRMDQGFRPRSNQSVIEEIELLKKKYGITFIFFSDELLMSSAERTVSLCESFIKHDLNVRWRCNGRLNYARPEVLKIMKRSGCVFINYGIESIDDQILRNMQKALTVEQIHKGIEATLAEGISPGFNIIFGNIGENVETLRKGVEFLLKYDDGSQMRTIRPVTPYPGSPLFYEAIKRGLLKGTEDFYENKHINSDLLAVNFTDLTDDDFHRALFEANQQLIENYFEKKLKSQIAQAKKLYLEKDVSFRGFRQN